MDDVVVVRRRSDSYITCLAFLITLCELMHFMIHTNLPGDRSRRIRESRNDEHEDPPAQAGTRSNSSSQVDTSRILSIKSPFTLDVRLPTSYRHSSSGMTHTIFPPFNVPAWRAIDDRIRGGSSVSHLDPYPSSSSEKDTAAAPAAATAVRFWGTLDTKTLGGAGFASQCYTFPGEQGLWLDTERYAGLGIEFDVASPAKHAPKQAGTGAGEPERLPPPTRFTLVLKTSIPPTRPDGRRQSTLSYEYTFTSHTSPTHASTRRLTIPWSAFVPTYRGRPITPGDPEYTPLDPGSRTHHGHGKRMRGGIRELSLMCRSDFGKQEGAFELVVRRIDAVPVVGRQGGEERGGDKGDLERQQEARARRVVSRFPGTSCCGLISQDVARADGEAWV